MSLNLFESDEVDLGFDDVTIKKEEVEDWACNVSENEIKPELDQDLEKSASTSTLPTISTDSIKQETTDTEESEACLNDVSKSDPLETTCSSVCDSIVTAVKIEEAEAAVNGNDVWLQRLVNAYASHEVAVPHHDAGNYEEEYDGEVDVTNDKSTAPKHSIPITLGKRKFVLVPHSISNNQNVAQHKQQLKIKSNISKGNVASIISDSSLLRASILCRLNAVKPQSKSNINSHVVANHSQSIPVAKPLPYRITEPEAEKPLTPYSNPQQDFFASKSMSEIPPTKSLLTPSVTTGNSINVIQPPQNQNSNCPINNTMQSLGKSNVNPAATASQQRSQAINRILERSLHMNRISPTTVPKKVVYSMVNGRMTATFMENVSPQNKNSFNKRMTEDGKQVKVAGLTPQSHKLLTILEAIKASKRFERSVNKKSPVVANVKPIKQSKEISPAQSLDTVVKQLLTYVNSDLPHPLATKSAPEPIRFSNYIPTSVLEVFLTPCFVKLERLKILTCVVCKKLFFLKSEFVQHVFEHVKKAETNKSVKSTCPCDICGKEISPKYLNIHINKEHGPKKFWCDHCGKKCPDRASIISHLVAHSEKRPFRCKICNKRFRRNGNLASHMIMHTVEKPHQCVICHKRFSREINLKKHSVYHLAKRPYGCKICEKRFCHQFHLERHMLVHTGERPFACDICNMRFTRSSHRDRHLLVHTRRKKYACKICKKKFEQRTQLSKHKRVHDNE